MYHKIGLNTPSMWWVSVNAFYRQMSELQNKEVVYLDDYDLKNPNHVVITFDGIYKNVYQFALPILKHFNYPFELFFTSNYIGLNNEFDSIEPLSEFTDIYELKELVKYGGRLQWHTKTHLNLKQVEDISIINEELDIPKKLLSFDENGFNWFAYPHGEFNSTVLKEVKKKFKGAVSCNQGNNIDLYLLNRVTVLNDTRFRKSKIACIIASYNYGDYLIEAIESVLMQTILPDEIIITDDFSDDDTEEISRIYSAKYPNLIKYNRNEQNLGIVKNFNKAISLISSDYVFFLGADNRIVSNYVEECAKILDTNDNIGIAYTDYAFFGSRAKIIYDNFRPNWKGKVIENQFYQINFPNFKNYEELRRELNLRNFIHGSSMYKKECFEQVGGYKQTNKAEDYNFFKSIVDLGWMASKATETNLEYRQHSISQANNAVALQNKYMLYKKQYENLKNKQDNFEKTRVYKLAVNIYKLSNLIKNPRILFRKIKIKLINQFK